MLVNLPFSSHTEEARSHMSGHSEHPFPSGLGPYMQTHLSRWQVSPDPHVVAQQWSGQRPPLMHMQPYVVVPFTRVLEQNPFFLNKSKSVRVGIDKIPNWTDNINMYQIRTRWNKIEQDGTRWNKMEHD